eukprot:5327977-Alexandrium_andersonii.AAC.1
MDASLAAALSHPIPVTARPPERAPGPEQIREIYIQVAHAFRSGEGPLAPKAGPSLGDLLDPSVWAAMASRL